MRVPWKSLVLLALGNLAPTGSVLLDIPKNAAEVEQFLRRTNASLAIYFFSPTCSKCPEFTPVSFRRPAIELSSISRRVCRSAADPVKVL